jgi:peptidoglycan L-alanyl-D-glutamate endopeptidase CwlK
MFKYSERSKLYLSTCHEDLQKVFNGILGFRDCTILEGWRSGEKQDFYFNTGKSKLPWPESKHNYTRGETPCSLAVDAVPYPFRQEWWDSTKYFHIWAEWGSWVKGFAAGCGVKLRWGFDWDGDFDLKDQSFYDGPHFELVEGE